MALKPLADRVLIKVEKDQEEKTVGGLVLATKTPAGVPAKGKVVACGEGKYARHTHPHAGKGWRHGSAEPRRRSDHQGWRGRADTGLRERDSGNCRLSFPAERLH